MDKRVSPLVMLRDALLMGLAYGLVSLFIVEAVAFGYPTGSVFWPGAGLTLGVLVCRPRRTWPALLAGVFVAEVLVDLTIPVSLGAALLWAAANTVEPVVGAWLLTRRRTRVVLTDISGMLRFLGFGVVVGPLIGATVGAVGAVVMGIDTFWPTWPRWWVGDAIGVLLIAPAIIVWNSGASRGRAGSAEARWIIAGLVAVVTVSLIPWAGDHWQQGLPFLIAPVLVVVALRMSPRAATVSLALTGFSVNAVTAAGIGPFADYGTDGGLVVAQVCLAAAAFAELIVMALSHDLVTMRQLGEHRTAMANVLAHELKNPLTAIMGNAEFLEPDASPERMLMARRAIERGARRMVETIDDMMALAQIDDPNSPRVLVPVDLAELVTDAIELNEAAAARASVDLGATLIDRPAVVLGEQDELDKLVHNLISNAIKYTPPGGAVTVSCGLDEDHAVLVVEDEGIGIAPEDRARLFDEFFRSSDPAVRDRPGTGLGLAIVRRVIDRHHGSISVESQPGVGSTFMVRLPRNTAQHLQVSSRTLTESTP